MTRLVHWREKFIGSRFRASFLLTVLTAGGSTPANRKRTGAGADGENYHNAFPLMHTTAVYQGQRAETSDKRAFILTRSAYAGQQRNAAVTWSGDIHGTWPVFQRQIPAGLNFSISGIPYWNTDTGGFFIGIPDAAAYAELFTRWFQFSAFCPMFRVHGTDRPKEMWRFDSATQKILIAYDELRYHLIPYIYSVSWQVTQRRLHDDASARHGFSDRHKCFQHRRRISFWPGNFGLSGQRIQIQ